MSGATFGLALSAGLFAALVGRVINKHWRSR